MGSLGWVTANDWVILAPLLASEVMYGALALSMTSLNEWFSSMTTTMWSYPGSAAWAGDAGRASAAHRPTARPATVLAIRMDQSLSVRGPRWKSASQPIANDGRTLGAAGVAAPRQQWSVTRDRGQQSEVGRRGAASLDLDLAGLRLPPVLGHDQRQRVVAAVQPQRVPAIGVRLQGVVRRPGVDLTIVNAAGFADSQATSAGGPHWLKPGRTSALFAGLKPPVEPPTL